MSAQDCIDEIRAAAGRDLSDEDIERILDALDRRLEARKASASLDSLEDALLDEADSFARDIAEAAQIERRNRLINVKVEAELGNFVDEVKLLGGSAADAVKAKQVGVNAPIPGGRRSAGTDYLALFRGYVGGMLADIRKEGPDLVALMGRRDMARPIAQELAELSKRNGEIGISGNADAVKIAKVVDKYRRLAVARENRAGAWIKPLEGYVTRQSHDMFRLRRAGFPAWRDAVLPLLDAEKTFAGADPEKFLKGAFEFLTTGEHLKARGAAESDLAFAFKGPGNLAKRASQSRVLHFRNADAWFDYNERFGTGSLIESVISDFNRAARNTALMRTFGTNPRATRDKWVDGLRKAARSDIKESDALKAQTLDWQFDEIDGTASIPVRPSLARTASSVVALQSMAKLGGAGVAASGDLFFKASDLRFLGFNLLGAYRQSLDDAVRIFPAQERRQIGELLAVGFETQLGDIMARFSATDNVPGALSKATRLFFKLNLLGPITDAHKRGMAMVLARDLAMNRGVEFGALRPELRDVMRRYNIDESRWDVYRQHAVREAPDGREYVFPEAIREIDDSALAGLVEGKSSRRKLDNLRDEMETALTNFYVDRAEFASPTPGAEERALLRFGTKAGTPMGVAVQLLAQFKSFPVTVTTKVIGRELFGRSAPGTTLTDALFRGKGDLIGLAHLIVATTVIGYGVQSAKQLSRGLTPRDPEDPETWVSAALQGGGLGIYGDFMFGEYNRFGRSLTDTLAGPTLGEINTIAELWARARQGDDFAAQGVRFITQNAPFVNLFYTRQALDILILNQITEMMNPGSLRRREQRLKRQSGQKFLIPPSQTIPRGGGRAFEGVR